MAANPFTQTDNAHPSVAPAHAGAVPVNRALVAQAEPEVMSGASWFWWIAGLSLVNSIMTHSGSDTGFIIGLGFAGAGVLRSPALPDGRADRAAGDWLGAVPGLAA